MTSMYHIILFLTIGTVLYIYFSSLCSNVYHPASARKLTTCLTTPGLRNDVIEHPYLSKECYLYRNLQAQNVCCKMQMYTSKEVQICGINMATKNNEISTPAYGTHLSIPTSGNHWVFVGNSRVRKLMYSIVKIFNCPGTIINQTNYHQHIRVTHRSLPLNFTFFWDPYLTELPYLTKLWNNNTYERPTRLHLGHGVNYMRYSWQLYSQQGQESAAVKFKQQSLKVLPFVTELAKTIPVTWQLEEYAMESLAWSWLKDVWSNQNVEYYNSFLRNILKGSGVVVMDAHIPLGELFIEDCTRDFRNDTWNCKDVVHQGLLAFLKYAQFWLNHACNHFIDSGQQTGYC